MVWKLSGSDATDFHIGNQDGGTLGQLTFKEMPDYEMPAASNNLYRVTVEVSDGKLKATRPVTVMVIDQPEEGTVKLSTVAPKEGVALTASLKDSDGGVADVTWQWWKSSVAEAESVPSFLDNDEPDTASWMKIDDAESATYEPVTGDIDDWLTAMASYTDRRGTGNTEHKSSDAVVIINHDNRAPSFKKNGEEITETTRKVREDAKKNVAEDDNDTTGIDERMQVGEPVQATDPNSDDNLTYKLTGADAALFEITSTNIVGTTGVDEEGLLSLKAATELDYEDKNTYMVTVTATDPNGLSDSVDVTIKVTDEDEAPRIIVGGLVVTGTSDINYAENGTGMVTTYSAAGPDAAGANWSLSGADAGALRISSAGVLTFMAPPNYESPADANTDNIYMVMVNANNGTNDAMKAVTITVTNEEERGEVTLWASATEALTMAPQVGDTITGAVMDPDGNPGDMPPIAIDTTINDVTWQWSRTMDTANMSSWMDIQDATDAAYMVMEGDTGYHLRVMATYTDAAGTDMAMEYSMPTMMVTVVDEMLGEVTLWAGDDALTMAPQVGDTITGAVMDPDGGVTGETWQWAKTMTPDMMDSWMSITGATDAAYLVMEGDTGYHLRVMATYTDAVGTDMAMVYSMPTMMVTAEAGDTLLDRYDVDGDGIEKTEVLKAINDYLFGEGDEAISKPEVLRLINLYLFG